MTVDSLFTDGPYLAGKYFWIAAIVLTALNTYVLRRRAPGAGSGLRHGVFLALASPWVVFGILQYLGLIDTAWQLSRPQDLHPGTWIVYGFVLLTQLAFTWWTLARNGASVLATSPLFQVHSASGQRSLNPATVKFVAAVVPLISIAAIAFAWTADFPIPVKP